MEGGRGSYNILLQSCWIFSLLGVLLSLFSLLFLDSGGGGGGGEGGGGWFLQDKGRFSTSFVPPPSFAPSAHSSNISNKITFITVITVNYR